MIGKKEALKNGEKLDLNEIYYSEEEKWEFARKMAEEVTRHNKSSPETKKMIGELATILKNKIVFPKSLMYGFLSLILLLGFIAVGFTYKSYEETKLVYEELDNLQIEFDEQWQDLK